MEPDRESEIALVLAQANAVRDALRFAYNSDSGNTWRFGSFRTFMNQYNDLARALGKLSPTAARTLKTFQMDNVKGQFDTMDQKSYCDSTLSMLSMLISIAERDLGTQTSELGNIINFLQSCVRPAVMRTPQRERDMLLTVVVLLLMMR